MSSEDNLEEMATAEDAEVNEPGLESLMQEETEALLQGEGSMPDPFAEGEAPLAFSDAAPNSTPDSDGPILIPKDDEDGDLAATMEPDVPAKEEQAADDDLVDRAQAAAEAAVGTAEDLERRVLEAAQMLADVEATQTTPRPEKPRRTQRRDLMLVGLLFANLCLMGVMLALPGDTKQPDKPQPPAGGHSPKISEPEGGQGPEPGSKQGAVTESVPQPGRKFEVPMGERSSTLPDQEAFDVGSRKFVNGDYQGALETWRSYQLGHPELQPFQLHLVYISMAHAYGQLNDRVKALEYLAKAASQQERIALPDDLWTAAAHAERDGRGRDMRRYFARFLLQQDQLGRRWTRQGRIVEAFMKIADSYRLDAETGEVRAQRDLPEKKVQGPRPRPTTSKAIQDADKPKETKGGH